MNHDNLPLVTVIIPAYNHERYVVDAVRSIINQEYRNIELIIINDGSRDNTHDRIVSLAAECKHRFARYEYINRENVGLSATLNQALKLASGTYFSVLASDDIAFPNKIKLLVGALEANGPAYAAAFGNALFIDGDGHKVSIAKTFASSNGYRTEEVDNCLDYYSNSQHFIYRPVEFGTYNTLIAGNYLPSMSNVIRTSAISEVGGWTDGNAMEDWEMWLKLARTRKILYVDKPLASYRWHDLNTAKTTANGLISASLLVLNGEKAFCAENNLLSHWNAAHNRLILQLLRRRSVRFSRKLSLFMGANKASLAVTAAKRLLQRFR